MHRDLYSTNYDLSELSLLKFFIQVLVSPIILLSHQAAHLDKSDILWQIILLFNATFIRQQWPKYPVLENS